MSHGLDAFGSSMVSLKEVPWHNHPNCKVVQHLENIEACVVESGSDWEAEKEPLYYKDKQGNWQNAGSFAVIRQDNGVNLAEGRSVGSTWKVLQNRQAFKWFQPWVDTKQIQLETAGCLDGGRKVWIMASLNRDPLVISKNDEVKKFIMLSHAHDGTMAIRVGFTPVRIVCANTLAMAIGSEDSKLIRVRHSSKTEQNLDKIRETVDIINAQFETTAEKYKLLVTRDINQKDLEKYVKIVFKITESEKTGQISTKGQNLIDGLIDKFYQGLYGMSQSKYMEKAMEDIKAAMEAGRGSAEVPTVKGTWWNAYNAVTEYLSWNRGHNWDTRLNSLWFGDAFSKNKEALSLAVQMSA